MSAIPGGIDAEGGPPMTIPLRHFIIALGFLVAGIVAGATGGRAGTLAQVHLLLAGWVCLTIMGAMTQFVPVWSGVALHSRRLATLQLPLAAGGIAGLAGSFVLGLDLLLPVAGVVLVLGIWLFVYNVFRTLLGVQSYDVTERHFMFALGSFVLVTSAGLALATHRAVGLLPVAGISYASLLTAHATLAVFGAVLATVFGALYQLGTMFTQSECSLVDRYLKRYEMSAYPVGVVVFTGGRLFAIPPVAIIGGSLVATATFALAVFLARRVAGSTTDWTPMLSRYAVVSAALLVWSPLAGYTWLHSPLAHDYLFGPTGGSLLLLWGGIGFVVLGTVYHVVPFIVWVNRYSDQLGFEDVPLIDDLYDSRVAALDCWCFAVALVSSVLVSQGMLPAPIGRVAGALALIGACLFASNMLAVLYRHSDRPVHTILFGAATGS